MSESTSKRHHTNQTRKNHTNMAAVAPLGPKAIARLSLVVPRTEMLETLSRLQIPFPRKLPDITEDDAFPTDVTAIGPRELRQLQSYWTAQFARINALLGITRGELKAQERATDRAKLKAFHIHAQPKTVKDYTMGKVLRLKHIAEMERELDNLHRLTEALEALTKDFQMYVNALDRESMWRMAEMRISNGRGGGT
jgi:hypothetical protein